MNVPYLKTLVLMSLTFLCFSCEDDPICFNGGVYQGGACVCFNGYTGEYCETDPVAPDECENVICDNGECQNGECQCEEGYAGTNCSEQIMPSSFTINQIRINWFPEAIDGTWDNNNSSAFPDLFFIISTGQDCEGEILRTETVDNYDRNNLPYYYVMSQPILITNLQAIYGFCLVDFDSDLDHDLIGGGSDFIYNEFNDFPTEIQFSNASINFTIFGTWQH